MRIVNIAGISTKVEEKNIEINKIELDYDNPRISFYIDAQGGRKIIQKELAFALITKNPPAFEKLLESIEANKGVLHPIWVVHYGSNKYRVIEGNTRLMIYRQLQEKYLNDTTYSTIPCWILPDTINSDQMNFLRLEAHLRGTTDWDIYEKARYLYKLNEDEGYSINLLERTTKLNRNEIESYIRAFKDMEQQYLPKFGKDPGEVHKFSYFVEYEKNPKLQDIMKRNSLSINDLCGWIGDGKINRALDIRELPDILEIEEVRKEFIERGYDYAIEKLDVIKPNKTDRLFQNIERVIDGLMNLSNWEINEMRDGTQPYRIESLTRLNTILKKTKDLIEGIK